MFPRRSDKPEEHRLCGMWKRKNKDDLLERHVFITIEICKADGEVRFLAGLGGGLMLWNFSLQTLREKEKTE